MAWNFGKQPEPKKARMTERHAAHGLHCALGELVDLSSAGGRVKGKGKLAAVKGQIIPFVIKNESQSVRVQAQVAWVKKPPLGTGNYELGLRFIDMRPGIIKAVDQMARFGCITTDSALSGDEPQVETEQPKPAAKPEPPPPPPIKIEVENLYETLGVPMGADQGEIKQAFYKLAKQFHPDHNKEPEAADKFATINKCYLVLKDPAMRARYDAMLKRSA